ncbi:HAD-IA family hydrolase [Neobacillus mesonae]|nr:HAD-IA family hydrolase [Neobacillus mesonae]
MSNKIQLVLDAGGVITANLSPAYWKELSPASLSSEESIVHKFKREIREKLWSGHVTEADFYLWVRGHSSELKQNDEQFRQLVQGHLRLLPASEHLEEWSGKADLHILSNHRHEWLTPVLAPILPFIASCTISSEVGMCKPSASIYTYLHRKLGNLDDIYFVDDQERNLLPAREMGWKTILADPEGQWVETINELLG